MRSAYDIKKGLEIGKKQELIESVENHVERAILSSSSTISIIMSKFEFELIRNDLLLSGYTFEYTMFLNSRDHEQGIRITLS